MIYVLLLCRFTGLFLKHQFELKTCWVVSLIAVQSTGLSGWAAYNPPQKTLETRFLIPRKCQQHCCCRCLESVFQICNFWAATTMLVFQAQDQQSNKQIEKNARKTLPITSWQPRLEAGGNLHEIHEFTLRRSEKIQLSHRRILRFARGNCQENS